MNFSPQWLTATAAWAAARETSGPIEIGRPTGSLRATIRRPEVVPSESFVEERSVVLTWRGPVYAQELMPRRVWRPRINGLPSTFPLASTTR
jgi:hypothetical protein